MQLKRYRYEDEIREKADITLEELDILISILFEKIEVFPATDYTDSVPEAKELIEDVGDVPFLALALALKIDCIWSDDSHFLKQKKIKVYKTEQMAGFV